MDWLNYHHLHYFWTVAREGSMTRAAEVLHLTQPTLSAQVRQLEDRLGVRLFERQGRRLVFTKAGHTVYRYADEIFTLGQELQDVLRGRSPDRSLTFGVGVVGGLPSGLIRALLQPILAMPEPIRLQCHEGDWERLVERLSRYELDVVLSDRAPQGRSRGRIYSHALGTFGVVIQGTASLIQRFSGPFPQNLQGAPFLFPAEGSTLRVEVERWFQQWGIRPMVRGVFEDAELLLALGRAGEGFFPVPDLGILAAKRHRVGTLEGVRVPIHALSLERRLTHPAVRVIQAMAERILGPTA